MSQLHICRVFPVPVALSSCRPPLSSLVPSHSQTRIPQIEASPHSLDVVADVICVVVGVGISWIAMLGIGYATQEIGDSGTDSRPGYVLVFYDGPAESNFS